MPEYEYRVLPAPGRGTRAKGAKGTADRFALALTEALNAMAAEGWEYYRAERLPCEERKGLTGRVETMQDVLVFRREVPERGTATAPQARSPEDIARAAAASLRAGRDPGPAPSLGPARPADPAGPARRLGPARDQD